MTDETVFVNEKIKLPEKEKEQEKEKETEGNEKEVLIKKEKTRGQIIRKKLWIFFVKNYLPIALIFAVTFGALVPQPGVFFNHKATVYVCVATLFFYVGLYLPTSTIKDAIKAYKGYGWAILSILVITCMIGGNLTNLLTFDKLRSEKTNIVQPGNSTNQSTSNPENDRTISPLGPFEAKVGLIMYNIMPSSVGSGIIMVMGIKGHVALGILITVFCNIVGIFTIPLYLKWLVYSDISTNFNIGKMMLKLFGTLFVPLFIGFMFRFNKKVHDFINKPSLKIKLKMFALSALAFILLIKTSQSSQNGELSLITGTAAAVIFFWALTLHIIYLVINTTAVIILRLPIEQKKCVIILASQKTLSQAVAASVFLPSSGGDQGLIAVTMVFCHISILVFDSVLIPLWLYIEEKRIKKIEREDYDRLL